MSCLCKELILTSLISLCFTSKKKTCDRVESFITFSWKIWAGLMWCPVISDINESPKTGCIIQQTALPLHHILPRRQSNQHTYASSCTIHKAIDYWQLIIHQDTKLCKEDVLLQNKTWPSTAMTVDKLSNWEKKMMGDRISTRMTITD